MVRKLDPTKLPKHIAIIMDGNRRWARKQGLNPAKGHEFAALNTVEPLIEKCGELGIPYVTFWAWSTENWKREPDEVDGIFYAFRLGLKSLAKRFISKGAKLNILGDINKFPVDIVAKVKEILKTSIKNHKITVNFALHYGGRDEILRAVKKIVSEKIDIKNIDEKIFSEHLDTAGMPDPDIIIRTGGEQRTSGYLPWQSVYSELFFTKTLFPDFSPAKLQQIIKRYQDRDRRMGK